MPVAPEVNPFQSKVRGNQRILLLAPVRHQSQHGAVVSNSGLNRRILCTRRHPANLGNQRFFGDRHSATTISDATGQMLNCHEDSGNIKQPVRYTA